MAYYFILGSKLILAVLVKKIVLVLGV